MMAANINLKWWWRKTDGIQGTPGRSQITRILTILGISAI